MDEFIDSNKNYINIAILGAVSVGKSTLVNTIFAETYSKCKIKRYTMTPQVYIETDAVETETAGKIYRKNSEINNKLVAKTETGETVSLDDIKERVYLVPKVYDFTELEEDNYLRIYNIPGLNDARSKDVYFEYMDNNFKKFDIVIFVVDINSSLNTGDEVDILVTIVENCKLNSEKHGIHNKLIILANKCDEMTLSTEGKPKLEGEQQEMMNQLQTLVKEKVDNIFPSLDYKIKPLSLEDSYIYRMYDRNKETEWFGRNKETEWFELDMKYLNKFGYNEYGKTRWNKLNKGLKRAKINKLLVEIDMDETMNITGFNGFRKVVNKFLSPSNQKIYIINNILQGLAKIVGNTKIDISGEINHILHGLVSIVNNTKIDISADIQLFYKYLQHCKSLEMSIKVEIYIIYIFLSIFNKYLDGWDKSILMEFLDVDKLYTLKQVRELVYTLKLVQTLIVKILLEVTDVQDNKNILKNILVIHDKITFILNNVLY